MFRINKEMFIQFIIITGGTGGLIYIDPSTLRRTTTVTTTSTPSHDSAVTMTTTASQLARGFGIIIRQIADLLTMLQDYHALAPGLPRTLDITDQEAIDLQVSANKTLLFYSKIL
jgi:E3 ubiquitin-protein ligase EDD1